MANGQMAIVTILPVEDPGIAALLSPAGSCTLLTKADMGHTDKYMGHGTDKQKNTWDMGQTDRQTIKQRPAGIQWNLMVLHGFNDFQ